MKRHSRMRIYVFVLSSLSEKGNELEKRKKLRRAIFQFFWASFSNIARFSDIIATIPSPTCRNETKMSHEIGVLIDVNIIAHGRKQTASILGWFLKFAATFGDSWRWRGKRLKSSATVVCVPRKNLCFSRIYGRNNSERMRQMKERVQVEDNAAEWDLIVGFYDRVTL